MDSSENTQLKHIAVPLRGMPLSSVCELFCRGGSCIVKRNTTAVPLVSGRQCVSPLDISGRSWQALFIAPSDPCIADFAERLVSIIEFEYARSNVGFIDSKSDDSERSLAGNTQCARITCTAYETLCTGSTAYLTYSSELDGDEVLLHMNVSCALDCHVHVRPTRVSDPGDIGRPPMSITVPDIFEHTDGLLTQIAFGQLHDGAELSQLGWSRQDIFIPACANIADYLMTLYRLFWARVAAPLLKQVRFMIPTVACRLHMDIGTVTQIGVAIDVGIVLGYPYPNDLCVHWLWPITVVPSMSTVEVPAVRLKYYDTDRRVCDAVEDALLNL